MLRNINLSWKCFSPSCCYCCRLIHILLSPPCHFFSLRMRCASCMSFGIIVTHFPWIAHRLVSSKRPTRHASEASWRARTAVLCIRQSDLISWAISQTRRWNGAFLIKRFVFFWYLRISQRATVPGRQRWGFFMPPPKGSV